MIVLGLTGGVGMGKSACAAFLRDRSIPVIDTDDLARQFVEPGQPALAEIRKLFGDDVIGADGQLRRKELARRVFSDPDARRQLEAILHPRIRQAWLAQVQVWRNEGKPLAVVAIPLLFETHAQKELDATLCIACSPQTQQVRLQARGWSEGQIQQRIAAQWSIEQKMTAADYVIWTEGSLEIHAAQLERLLRHLPLGALA